MKILAIDTATERCSAALLTEARCLDRTSDTPRAHAELILPMVAELLAETELKITDLDAIAYGRGPGAFTGVRIAVAVAQGLAFGAHLPTIGVSNLAAVAQQVAAPGERVLVCMDARMDEVYCGFFERPADSLCVQPLSMERVLPPNAVELTSAVHAGTGFKAYPQLQSTIALRLHADALPRAADIAVLAAQEYRAGRMSPAAEAAPVYLRDQVARKKQ